MSTAERMAKGFDKNKDLIKAKKGLPNTNKPKSRTLKNTTGKPKTPSNKISDSGKQTVDPKKNTEIPKKEPSQGLKKDSKDRDIKSDVDQGSADRRKQEIERKERERKTRRQELKQNVMGKVKDAAGELRRKTKSAGAAATGAFGSSSFAKETITFSDYLNKL